MKIQTKLTRLITSAIVIASLFTACGKNTDKTDQEIADSVESLLKSMTLKEKVCQMFVIRPEAIDERESAVLELDSLIYMAFEKYPVGGFCLFAKNITDSVQLIALNKQIHELRFRPLICVDEEGGRVARVGNNDAFNLTKFPNMGELSKNGDPADTRYAGSYMGNYLRRYGFDADLAPVADVNTNPENQVIGTRAFSDNPETAAKMMVSFMKGFKESKMACCLKHFPGHGDVKNDTHTGYVASYKSWEEMLNCEMIPFKAGIQEGTDMVMVAHVATPNVSGDNLPSTLSPTIITGKLKNELKFKGIIITDSMGMGAITKDYSSAEATLRAVKAGVDIVLIPQNLSESCEALVKAVEDNTIPESRIDESVRKILTLKASCQLRLQ